MIVVCQESMERGMNEVENDNSCLSADLELVDRLLLSVC